MSGESQISFANSSVKDAAPMGPSPSEPAPSHLRPFAESLLCLALAVIVFRAFVVEGYMISTGSMAPALLGFHKQVVCPTCKFPFTFGVAYQPESSRTISGDGDMANGSFGNDRQYCTCPNCGQRAIDISQVPRNQGDQLLVFREAYWWRSPRRWEVIVFRNPYETTQAYVKRLAGLPGETIQIRDGDVYANGTLCRKDYETQKAVRIPVYDHDHEPMDDPLWTSRWQPGPGWRRDGQGFETQPQIPAGLENTPNDGSVFDVNVGQEETAWSWVTYGHYLRSGGRHNTWVELPLINQKLEWPANILPARFDVKTRQLSVAGVMPDELYHTLREVSNDPKYIAALDQLAERSHYAPVTDEYGYNRDTSQSSQNAVRDLMISVELNVIAPEESAERQFALDMGDGEHAFRLLLDFGRGEVRLVANPDSGANAPLLRRVPLRSEWLSGPCQVEMSLIDRQVTAAVNGEEIFEAWPIPTPTPKTEAPRFPVRLGSRGLVLRVNSLQLFRDVYYTSNNEQPFTLKDDELYVLGDNSPVSLDSRRWKNGAVPTRLLLGKPFVVHLPSRQMKVRIGETHRHIRMPDIPRIRSIR